MRHYHYHFLLAAHMSRRGSGRDDSFDLKYVDVLCHTSTTRTTNWSSPLEVWSIRAASMLRFADRLACSHFSAGGTLEPTPVHITSPDLIAIAVIRRQCQGRVDGKWLIQGPLRAKIDLLHVHYSLFSSVPPLSLVEIEPQEIRSEEKHSRSVLQCVKETIPASSFLGTYASGLRYFVSKRVNLLFAHCDTLISRPSARRRSSIGRTIAGMRSCGCSLACRTR